MWKYFSQNISVAYPSSQVSYRWHNPTLAVGYEGELQLSQFDIINTKYRQVNYSRDATGESQPSTELSLLNIEIFRNFLGVASGLPPAETHRIFSNSGEVRREDLTVLGCFACRFMFPAPSLLSSVGSDFG